MKKKLHLFLTAFILLLFFSTKNFGQAPNLGATSSFALFSAAGAFSNDGASIVTGDIGTNVGAFSGFPPGIVIGQIHVADPASAQAASDVDLAYSALSGTNCGMVLGTTLGNNQVLVPNVYCLGAASTLNGELILDGAGSTTGIFIFQIDGALSTSTLASVTLINGASLCNVYWQVNGAFDLGEGSVFRGTVIANGEITLLEGSSLIGRGLTRAGAISLHNNIVNVASQPTASVISATTTTTFCAGGSVILSGNDGGIWSTGSASGTITVSESGDYFVTNSANCGEIISNHIIVTVNPLPTPTISANGPLTFCSGGSVVLTASSGSSYLWSTGETTQSITVTASGSYSVSVTNANGCTGASAATAVTVNPNPIVSISASGPTSFCTGGSVVLTASSGSSYLWSTGETTQSITVTASGSYTVSVTNANGCTGASAATAVTVNPNPIVSISANGPTSFCGGGSVVLTASSGSSYLWSTGETTQSITVTETGSYSVSVTNANGCTGASAATAVTVNPNPIVSISANGPTSFCGGGSVVLTASSGSSYLWSTGETTQSITVTETGSYSVSVTNANGCTGASAATAVTVNPNPIVSISASGPTSFCTGGSVVLTASAGSSFVWSTGATTQSITVTTAGSYTVSVTNANGCTGTSAPVTVTVNNGTAPVITANGPLTFCAGGNVILTATAAGNYLWSTGATTQSITVSASGNYTVTTTGDCGGTSAATVVIVNPNPTATISVNGPLTFCQGGNVILTASAGSSYLWSTGATTASITVTATGNYAVTVTNANGCSQLSAAVSVLVNPNPVATISANGPTNFCQGGTVILTASSGSSYVWSTGATTASITVTASGSYFVTVTNANNCSAASAPVVVNVTTGAIPVITANGPTTFCQGGSVVLTASPASNYSWSTGAVTQSITVTASGNYTVTTTGTCGGTSAATSVTVNPNPAAIISANGPLSFCLGGNVILTASSGSSYLWNTGATTASITVTASGSYSVTVTNANGCSSASAAVVVLVTPNPVPTITANGPLSFCVGGNVILTASGATTYLWSNGATTQSITVTAAGSYSVKVTSACGTATSLVTVIVVNPLPTCSITGNAVICAGQSTQLCAPAGNKAYLWSNGATTSCITVSTAGTYSVRVTNNSNCSSTCYKTVTTSPAPDCMITGNSVICTGGSTQLCAPAGCASYLWSNGATTRCITVSSAGTYSVTVTNSGGCSSTCTKIITTSPAPDCTITGNSVICTGGSTQLCAPAGCASYLWSNGATTRCITVSSAGTYSVTVTNSGGCSSTCTKIITTSPAPDCTITGNSVICTGGSTQLCAPAGCASYLWSNGATTRCITVSSAGTYSVTVTNSGGCSSTCTKIITTSPAPDCTITGNSVICTGGSTQLCAPAGCATYLWSTGATCRCITVTAPGTYTVTVTNSNGCSSTCTKIITASPAPDCTITGNLVICSGQSTQLCAPAGCATYLWSNGATTRCITVSSAGTYSVSVTNSGGCSSTCSKTVTVSAAPSCTITGNSVICSGQSTQLCAPAGCASYLWSNGATTRCITVSSAGTYSVTVTNSGGCSSTCSKTITVSAAPSCTITGNSVICSGQSTELCAPAGCATYLWSNGATCRCITVTAAGTYTVTVTNSNGCSSTCTKTVTTASAPTCSITGNASFCEGLSTQLCAPSGCATYLWSNGATTRCITVTCGGTFSVTTTNAGGCKSTCSKTVTMLPKPACTISGTLVICAGQTTQLSAPAGCATYLWSTGATTRTIKVKSAGTYTVTVTNSNGCSNTVSVRVTMGTARGVTTSATAKVSTSTEVSPLSVNLEAHAFPNPFVSTVTIEIVGHLNASHVTAEIFNLSGKRVAVLFNGELDVNKPRQLKFNASGLPDGIYLYRISNGEEILNGKIMLIK